MYTEKSIPLFCVIKNAKIVYHDRTRGCFCESKSERHRKAAREYGYTVFQCGIKQEFVSFRDAVECLIGKNVDGVVLIPPEQIDKAGIDLVKALQNSRIPLLLLDRAVYSVFCDFVTADNKQGGRLAAEALIRQGHRQIDIIMGGANTYTARKRMEGYREAFARNQMAIEDHFIVQGEYTLEAGCRGAKELFEKGVRAMFASNDCIARGVYRFADERGLKIGRDLSVVGYDNTEICRWLQPPLTSIDQNTGQMAEKAVELLIRRIEGGDGKPARNYYFTPVLVERNSV